MISLTLKSGKQSTLDSSFMCIINAIADEFRRHSYIMSADFFDEYEKERYKKFQQEKATVNEYKSSLKFLCQCLEIYHNRKVILLVDEYDVPLEGAYVNHFYEEMIDFIRELFGAVLKTNESLYFAVLTGCLCIGNEAPSSLGSKIPHQVVNARVFLLDSIIWISIQFFQEPTVSILVLRTQKCKRCVRIMVCQTSIQ